MSVLVSVRLVFTTLPDAVVAGKLARQMVELGLAACVNVLAPCRSVYRWQGDVLEDGESPLIIKTTVERLPALRDWLLANHPYELPEFVAVEIADGLPDYLAWVEQSTRP